MVSQPCHLILPPLGIVKSFAKVIVVGSTPAKMASVAVPNDHTN